MPFEKSILFGDLPVDANAMGMKTINEIGFVTSMVVCCLENNLHNLVAPCKPHQG